MLRAKDINPDSNINSLLLPNLLYSLDVRLGNQSINTPFRKDSIPSTANIEGRLPLEKFEKAKRKDPNSKEKNPDSHIDGLSFVNLSTTREVFLILNIIAKLTIKKLTPNICPIII